MKPQDVIAALKQVPLIEVLEPDEIAQLAQQVVPRRYAPDEQLFMQGEQGGELFLVVRGAIRIALETLNGREVTVAIRRAGSFVGEMALLDGYPRSASGYAIDECECLVVLKDSFDAMIEGNARAGQRLIQVLCERIRQSTTRLEEVAVRTIRQRLASVLAKLAREEGEPDGTAVLLRPIVNYKMLTGLMCANRESVSRAASELIDEGLLARQGRRFRIIDMEGLESVALEA